MSLMGRTVVSAPLWAAGFLILLAAPGKADAGEAEAEAEVEALLAEAARLPEPGEQAPILAGEVHVDVVLPLARDALCPDMSACIFGGGAGVGGWLERRLASGLSLGLGLDFWFLDGGGVYEITVVPMMQFGLRYFFMREAIFHPFISAGVGALWLGETFRVSSVGAAVEAFSGVETELSRRLGVIVAMGARVLSTTRFTTRSDQVDRGARFGPNVAWMLRVGLTLLGDY